MNINEFVYMGVWPRSYGDRIMHHLGHHHYHKQVAFSVKMHTQTLNVYDMQLTGATFNYIRESRAQTFIDNLPIRIVCDVVKRVYPVTI